MSKSYTSLKQIIIDKLEAIVDDQVVPEPIFVEVLGVNKPASGYPMAYVMEKTGGGQILDTHRNEREWQFSVVIHQEVGTKTVEQAYEALLDAVDRVIETFDQDPLLKDINGEHQCKWVRVVPVEFEYAPQETQVHRALLTLAVVDVVNRYPA